MRAVLLLAAAALLASCQPAVADAGACAADFDGDGRTTVYDWIDFHAAWQAGDPAADFDRDGVLTERDELRYMDAWWWCWEHGG